MSAAGGNRPYKYKDLGEPERAWSLFHRPRGLLGSAPIGGQSEDAGLGAIKDWARAVVLRYDYCGIPLV